MDDLEESTITSYLENESFNEGEKEKRMLNMERHTSEMSPNLKEVSFNEETDLDEDMIKVYHFLFFTKSNNFEIN